MNLPGPRIQDLVPHQGTMCLLEHIVAWNSERVHCSTGSHRDPANPLRDPLGLRALHLCEYGAQAMAVHGGLLAAADGATAQPGLLVSLRGVVLHCDRIDGLAGLLDVHAERLLAGPASWQYHFRVLHGATLLAEGRAAVMLRGD